MIRHELRHPGVVAPITKRTAVLSLLLVGFLVLPLAAQDEAADGSDTAAAAAAANNPLADITSFQFQNYYASDLYGMPNESSNTAWMRLIKPFGKVLFRASLPLSTVPSVGNDSISGIGDLNIFAAYLMTDPSAPQQYGIGPLVAAPTASDDALGVDAWQAVPAEWLFASITELSVGHSWDTSAQHRPTTANSHHQGSRAEGPPTALFTLL